MFQLPLEKHVYKDSNRPPYNSVARDCICSHTTLVTTIDARAIFSIPASGSHSINEMDPAQNIKQNNNKHTLSPSHRSEGQMPPDLSIQRVTLTFYAICFSSTIRHIASTESTTLTMWYFRLNSMSESSVNVDFATFRRGSTYSLVSSM